MPASDPLDSLDLDTLVARYEGWFTRLNCEGCGEVFEVEDDVSNGEEVTCDSCRADLVVEGR